MKKKKKIGGIQAVWSKIEEEIKIEITNNKKTPLNCIKKCACLFLTDKKEERRKLLARKESICTKHN